MRVRAGPRREGPNDGGTATWLATLSGHRLCEMDGHLMCMGAEPSIARFQASGPGHETSRQPWFTHFVPRSVSPRL